MTFRRILRKVKRLVKNSQNLLMFLMILLIVSNIFLITLIKKRNQNHGLRQTNVDKYDGILIN
jgi:hypothetical protein